MKTIYSFALILLASTNISAQSWGVKWLKTDLEVDVLSESQSTLVSMSAANTALNFHQRNSCLENSRDNFLLSNELLGNVTDLQSLGNGKAFFQTIYEDEICDPFCTSIFLKHYGLVRYTQDTAYIDSAFTNLYQMGAPGIPQELFLDNETLTKVFFRRDPSDPTLELYRLVYYSIDETTNPTTEISFTAKTEPNFISVRNCSRVSDTLFSFTLDYQKIPGQENDLALLQFGADTVYLQHNINHFIVNQHGEIVDINSIASLDTVERIYCNNGFAYFKDGNKLKKMALSTGELVWTSAESFPDSTLLRQENGAIIASYKSTLFGLLHENQSHSFYLLDSLGNTVWHSVRSTNIENFLLTPAANGDWIINGTYADGAHFNGNRLASPPFEEFGKFTAKIGEINSLTALVPQNAYCAGDSIAIQVSGAEQVEANNVFQIELSDSLGGFNSPTVVSSGTSLVHNIVLPTNLPEGGTYKFRVRSSNPALVGLPSEGCLFITSAIDAPVVTPADSQFICLPNRVILRAVSGLPITWNTNDVGDSITPSFNGNYFAFVRKRGCWAKSNEVYYSGRNAPQLPSIPAATTYCSGLGSVFALPHPQAGATWTGHGVVNDTLFLSLVDSSQFNLTYTLSNRNCIVNANMRVQVLQPGEGNCILVKNQNLELSKIAVFPNPAWNAITVSFLAKSTTDCELRLIDGTGRLISKLQVLTQNGANEFKLPIAHIQAGLYLIQLKANSGIVATYPIAVK